MRLINKRPSMITLFENLDRDTQHLLCVGISQDFLEDYNRDISPEKISEAFIQFNVEVSVTSAEVELIRNDALAKAINVFLNC